jgi:hypothetical protein
MIMKLDAHQLRGQLYSKQNRKMPTNYGGYKTTKMSTSQLEMTAVALILDNYRKTHPNF